MQTALLAAMVKTPTFAISPDREGKPGALAQRALRITGFTLLELLVVIAIAAMLVSVVPTAVDKLRESSQYRDTVRAMVVDLRRAHHLATASGTPVMFQVDLVRREFGIAGQPIRKLPSSLEVKTTVGISNGAPNKDHPATITFLPEGGATGGTVELIRQSGAGVRIRVDWLLGQITQESRQP